MISKILPFLFLLPLIAEERPNLIFILTDDHNRADLGCYGNPIVQTPHLDQMAAEGVLFEKASVTSAICTPSRVCYFLGQYERKHGINFNSGTALSQAAWAKSYPVLLRENGYFTGYVGKNHVPIGARGYDTGLMEASFDFWYAAHGHLRFYPKKGHRLFRHAKHDTQVEVIQEGVHEFLAGKESSYLSGAERFLSTRPQDQPFCLSICLNVPHGSSTSTMQLLPTDDDLYRTAYREGMEKMPLPPHYLAKSAISQPKLPADLLHTAFRQESYSWVDTPATVRERRVRHFQTITGVDRMVGQLRQQLDELGESDNTIIIFTSDHGLFNGEQGLGGKALNYEQCLAVPLIVFDPHLPREQRGQRRQELVQSIDLAPTLLDLGGKEIPAAMQGTSFLPLLRNEEIPWRQYAFAENLWSTYFGNPRIESVRSQRWKYIRYFANPRSQWQELEGVQGVRLYQVSPQQRERYQQWRTASIAGEEPVYEELYDLEADPHEVRNLATQPEHAPTLALLRAQCQEAVTAAYGASEHPAVVPLPPGTNAK
ncbi:sulfatase-like hydrolase/transferase [Roseibacillus ishigakijimensis]|uniref:Sulfatase-like hydrolase/transferase n=1 Tax=Roseibacillus ishigakijimensis TaxID=454146 RepID=A0A934VL75_9BACT|nr:sulfatase-like hydrolase/transferase [Roseibacillus ishigakijimensis]MBK1832831.1 sulfatase-like hydrolase/transferase [Roseibacillus ishigakijimensis]